MVPSPIHCPYERMNDRETLSLKTMNNCAGWQRNHVLFKHQNTMLMVCHINIAHISQSISVSKVVHWTLFSTEPYPADTLYHSVCVTISFSLIIDLMDALFSLMNDLIIWLADTVAMPGTSFSFELVMPLLYLVATGHYPNDFSTAIVVRQKIIFSGIWILTKWLIHILYKER